MQSCDACGQRKDAGPPYIDRFIEVTNSHNPKDHIFFCTTCYEEFQDWCDRVTLADSMRDVHEEEE